MEKLLNTKEVADVLRVHTNAVRKYIESGQLKAFKLGNHNKKRHWRIKESDLEKFIAEALTDKTEKETKIEEV